MDEKGRRRAEIFYETAPFNGRHAALYLCRRFHIEYNDADNRVFVMDTHEILHAIFISASLTGERYERIIEACRNAEEWLNWKFPDWRNFEAYWDEKSEPREGSLKSLFIKGRKNDESI